MKLTDAQWQAIQPILGQPKRSASGGRPRTDNRQIVNGILWVLLNGTQWAELHSSVASYVTCWRRYKEWHQNGTWEQIWNVLFKTMDQKQMLEWQMALWKGHFIPVKKEL